MDFPPNYEALAKEVSERVWKDMGNDCVRIPEARVGRLISLKLTPSEKKWIGTSDYADFITSVKLEIQQLAGKNGVEIINKNQAILQVTMPYRPGAEAAVQDVSIETPSQDPMHKVRLNGLHTSRAELRRILERREERLKRSNS